MMRISIEGNGLMQRLTGIVERIDRGMREVFDEIGTLLIESVLMNFTVGGRPNPFLPTRRPSPPTPLRSAADVLMNSGQIAGVGDTFVEVSWGEGLPYAFIQNFGGTVDQVVTKKQRGFFWAKYYETGGEMTGVSREGRGVAGGYDAYGYKAMALSKELHITIPARRYMRIQNEDVEKIKSVLSRFILLKNENTITID